MELNGMSDSPPPRLPSWQAYKVKLRGTPNAQHQHRMPSNAAPWSAMTDRGRQAAQRRGYRFLSSWFQSLAVASHPLQPDSFILGVRAAVSDRRLQISGSFESIRG